MHLLLMLILSGLAWWGMTKTRAGVAWGHTLSAVCASLALVLAVLLLIPDNPSPDVMGDRVDGFAYAAGVGMGRHLATAFPDARVRVLIPPGGGGMGLSAEWVGKGLDAELKGNVQRLEHVQLQRPGLVTEEPAEANPEPVLSMSALRDALTGWKGELDLVVFLFSPPPGLLKAWGAHPEGMPAVAVISRDVTPLLKPIEDGVVSAALAALPDARVHENGRLIEPPGNPMKAFDLCYRVLTQANVAAFKENYSHIFRLKVTEN